MSIMGGRIVKLGSLAQYVLDRRIPLEMCLSSNVHTGAVRSLAEHPFKLYYDRGFRVTLNTDDRLMSDTSMTKEFGIAVETFGLELRDLEKVTVNAMKSAFLPFDGRLRLIYEVIKPGYDAVK
jgi:adenosine deaminase